MTQFEQADFKTSVHQRNEAFSRIASNYKKLGKYDEAISYYKKSTYRYGSDMPYKTQIDYEILYLQRDIEEKKNQPYRISFEGGLNEFEMGEPIKINNEFRNLTSDTLYFLEPSITYVDWEIYKDGEKVNPYIVASVVPMNHPTIGLLPNESRKMLGAPNDAYRFESGYALIENGQFKKAISLLEEFDNSGFSTTDHEKSYAFLRLGQAYFKMEEYKKAILKKYQMDGKFQNLEKHNKN